MKKHYNILLTGRVQRVGFRFYAMQAAYRYHINGTIKNKDIDKVYIEAEGAEEDIVAFVQWCKRGSPGSVVHDVQINEGELTNYESFDVIRGN
ncbi:MAG: acylphosphatase [Lentimicrobiaceae bacterium]|jgi:acylphosphatase|nr:acylphosphatase [Lentimicrobiaceae bacterium]